MSKISLQPNASGAGTFSIVAPDSNTNRTLTLPDESGTVFSDGTGVPGSALTGQLASSNMPAGSVIQVVSVETSTEVSTTSEQIYIDSGLSASITPQSTSSKILVLAQQSFSFDRSTHFQFCAFQLLRDSSQIINYQGDAFITFGFNSGNGSRAEMAGVMPIGHMDSPSTISEVFYKVQAANRNSSSSGILTLQRGGTPSTITLMEITG